MCLFKKQKKVIHFKFGVPYFDIYDTAYPEFPISVSVRGEISLTVNDYKKFLKENDVTCFENKVRQSYRQNEQKHQEELRKRYNPDEIFKKRGNM